MKYRRSIGLRRSIGSLLAALLLCSHAYAQDVKLDAPQVVSAGEIFNVSWEGPASDVELIVIAEPEASVYAPLSMASTVDGSPVTFTAPDPGTYEIRYITVRMKILASIPLVVSGAGAEADPIETQSGNEGPEKPIYPMLFALIAVDHGAEFHVIWTGDSSEGDRLLLRDESRASEIVAKQPMLSGTTMRFTAPSEPGHYSLQYFHKASRMIAVRRELEVR